MKKIEQFLGFILIFLVLILGATLLKSNDLFFRLLVGTGFGYALTRAYTGFAGSINRAFHTGSTKLMRTMMLLFFSTCLLTTAFLFKADPAAYDLWVNPINFGLLLGGILFGFGMAFSSCCASGVLTDLVTGLPRAFITLLFFGIGVFLAFPIQNSASWINDSWFTSQIGEQLYGGIFLPDLFKWDRLEGYLGALILTAIFCGIVVFIAYSYEKRRIKNNTFIGHKTEMEQDQKDVFNSSDYNFLNEKTYNRIFVKPWTLAEGAVVISILFTLLMGVTKAGWGASTPYGIWFGKLLMLFGISAESLSEFSLMPAEVYALPFFEHSISVQNFGILLGTLIYLLTAGKFIRIFKTGMEITVKEGFLYVLGGITMGVGTRFANGCNVGALYTPIANFSLSGWIFLIFMVFGGIMGNVLVSKWTK
ncbi:YeeE/YedE family protein [Anaerovorax sp. IOR16]|uniref:YeeE/YedE family protein n=1 Tax=Anaerovorax sp. IOR16 TaxID=2773458 RepID=UPI0019D0D661|nr:YeeE/YedE family protein [Anaerovorax sp. IOR16]